MTYMTLQQLYQDHEGKISDKWSLYLVEYDRLFSVLRDRPIRLLEIGIQNGGSLEIWSRYFSEAEKFVGCDINPDCFRLTYDDPRIAVVVSDANLDKTEEVILSHASSYDLIIDDGSHRSSDIVKSFARYFPHLEDGGMFVVEDLHCSYWQEFEGGLFDPYSSITFFKRLADVVSHEHWGVDKLRKELLAGFAQKYGISFDEDVLAHIHSIEFINSVCVIRKSIPMESQLGQRILSGKHELIAGTLREASSLDNQWRAPDQSSNVWALRSVPPDEELIQRLNELSENYERIANLQQVVAKRDGQIAALNQAVIERDEALSTLARVLSSTSWKITSPLRWLKRQIERI